MKTFSVLCIVFGLVGVSGSADAAGKETVTKGQRAKMAEAHDKMAACLRSDKPMKECKEEMEKTCPMMMKGKRDATMMRKGMRK